MWLVEVYEYEGTWSDQCFPTLEEACRRVDQVYSQHLGAQVKMVVCHTAIHTLPVWYLRDTRDYVSQGYSAHATSQGIVNHG